MFDQISLNNAQKRSEQLQKFLPQTKVKPGWIKYTRLVLGMTLKELAQLAGLSLPGVAQAERREAEGKVTVETLKKLASAMDCEFVYAFVPKHNIQDFLFNRAREKAYKMLVRADTHMSLEDQKVDEDLNLRVEALAQELFDKGDVW